MNISRAEKTGRSNASKVNTFNHLVKAALGPNGSIFQRSRISFELHRLRAVSSRFESRGIPESARF
jgi:hypothetical protein